jgi:uroporphyrinogen-III synthase
LTVAVIVTRPAAPGERLTRELQRRGFDVAWWPAFAIAAPPDQRVVDAALARLGDYDLALFVSPNAVHAVAPRLPAPWPARTAIGAVGAATREAARAELAGADRAPIVAPDDGGDSGSEGFWRAWQASGRSARRVLLLRAGDGRDWIVDRLREAGAEVDALAVYDRVTGALAAADCARLRGWLQRRALPIVVVSSTEAVDAVLAQVGAVDGAADWLRHGVALATHPRIAQRLLDAGFVRVETCSPDDPAVTGKLESIAR